MTPKSKKKQKHRHRYSIRYWFTSDGKQGWDDYCKCGKVKP